MEEKVMFGINGMEQNDIGALTPEQQEKLNEFKITTRFGNERYLREHPEVSCLLTGFLGQKVKWRKQSTHGIHGFTSYLTCWISFLYKRTIKLTEAFMPTMKWLAALFLVALMWVLWSTRRHLQTINDSLAQLRKLMLWKVPCVSTLYRLYDWSWSILQERPENVREFASRYFSNPELPSKVELQVAELNNRLKRTNRP